MKLAVKCRNAWPTLLLAGVLALPATAFANSSASSPATATGSGTQSSFSTALQNIRKNMTGSYNPLFFGPNVKSLSGNTDGSGTNLTMIHYFALGYRIGSKWRIGMTQPFVQNINENPASDPFVANDPYMTLTNPRIWTSKRYGTNLYGYIRYYAPFSRASSRAVQSAATTEFGHGRLRAYLGPSKSFMDGALNFNFQTLIEYRIASRSDADRIAARGNPYRNDWRLILDPLLSYSINPKLDVYVEYAIDMSHSTEGNITSKWSSWKKSDYVSPGVYITASKRLWLNPYLQFDPRIKELQNTGIGFQAVYSFL